MTERRDLDQNSTVLPASLRAEIEVYFGASVQSAVEIAGGEINRAAHIAIDGQTIFIKWNEQAPDDLYACEARGLNLLRATATLRVPEVLAVSTTFLALEYVGEGIIWNRRAWSKTFAESLAAMHRNLAPNRCFGGEPSYLGLWLLDNQSKNNWSEFWRDCRLVPQI